MRIRKFAEGAGPAQEALGRDKIPGISLIFALIPPPYTKAHDRTCVPALAA